jgi:hypothetical protein
MVPVQVQYVATDVTGTPTCSIDITSNEPINGVGDGNTNVDWQVLSPSLVRLRAERSGGGPGRVYTLTILCIDGAGNDASRPTEVAVGK